MDNQLEIDGTTKCTLKMSMSCDQHIMYTYIILDCVPALRAGWGRVSYDHAFGTLTCGRGMLHTIAPSALFYITLHYLEKSFINEKSFGNKKILH